MFIFNIFFSEYFGGQYPGGYWNFDQQLDSTYAPNYNNPNPTMPYGFNQISTGE